MIKKQPPEVLYKRGVLKKFVNCRGKNLSRSLFFNKIASYKRDSEAGASL